MSANLMRAALAVLVLGWSPILLYTAFGPPDRNPIGLGLFAWASIPFSLILAVLAGITFLLGSRPDRRA